MLLMVWDETLADVAQNWANQCKFQRGQVGHAFPDHIGQNLYHGTDPTSMEAMKMWYEEKENFIYRNNSCRPDEICGHFLQIIWADTRAIGCGVKDCGDLDYVIVCNYYPSGNISGILPYDELGAFSPKRQIYYKRKLSSHKEPTDDKDMEENKEEWHMELLKYLRGHPSLLEKYSNVVGIPKEQSLSPEVKFTESEQSNDIQLLNDDDLDLFFQAIAAAGKKLSKMGQFKLKQNISAILFHLEVQDLKKLITDIPENQESTTINLTTKLLEYLASQKQKDRDRLVLIPSLTREVIQRKRQNPSILLNHGTTTPFIASQNLNRNPSVYPGHEIPNLDIYSQNPGTILLNQNTPDSNMYIQNPSLRNSIQQISRPIISARNPNVIYYNQEIPRPYIFNRSPKDGTSLELYNPYTFIN